MEHRFDDKETFQPTYFLSGVGTWSPISLSHFVSSVCYGIRAAITSPPNHPTRTPYALRNTPYALRPAPCSLQARAPCTLSTSFLLLMGKSSTSLTPLSIIAHDPRGFAASCQVITIGFRTSSVADLSICPSIVLMATHLCQLSVCESWQATRRYQQSSAPSHPRFRRSVVSLHSETWHL